MMLRALLPLPSLLACLLPLVVFCSGELTLCTIIEATHRPGG